jgi:hypothetical protein
MGLTYKGAGLDEPSVLAPAGANDMAVTHLSAVPSTAPPNAESLARPTETGAQRIRRLQLEARMLAHEQVEALAHDFEAMAQSAAEIAEGGEAFPAGVRDLAARLAADLPQKALLLLTLMGRAAQA